MTGLILLRGKMPFGLGICLSRLPMVWKRQGQGEYALSGPEVVMHTHQLLQLLTALKERKVNPAHFHTWAPTSTPPLKQF